MSLLLSTFIELAIKFVILIAVAVGAVFCGIKLRKFSDKKKAQKEQN